MSKERKNKTEKIQTHLTKEAKELWVKKVESEFSDEAEYLRQLVCRHIGYVPTEKEEK